MAFPSRGNVSRILLYLVHSRSIAAFGNPDIDAPVAHRGLHARRSWMLPAEQDPENSLNLVAGLPTPLNPCHLMHSSLRVRSTCDS